jgi:hypothetical protein
MINLEDINVGTAPDSDDGDFLRDATIKAKTNVQQIADYVNDLDNLYVPIEAINPPDFDIHLILIP